VLTVSPAQADDVPAIADLMEELDQFYGATDIAPREQCVDQIQAALFGQPPAAYVLLARDSDRLVGLAAYSYLWPAVGLSRSMFLKELYVVQDHRGHGVGRLLMERLVQLAIETGCSRVEWMTERTNTDAQAFYDRLGHKEDASKVFYRLPL
jgi:GNAT superfamily N-acetyltransferase